MSPHCIIILLIFNFPVFHTDTVEESNLQGRIIKGFSVAVKQFPFNAAVLASAKFLCGATIISNRHLLTVAHRMNYSTEEYSVRVGSLSWFEDGDYIESIESVIIHPKYDKKTKDYNFAVIVLKELLTFSSTINKITLHRADVKPGEWVSVVGWGTTNVADTSMVSPLIKTAMMQTMSLSDCRRLVPKGAVITETMFCGQDHYKEQDVCIGDGGSPVFRNRTLYGVVAGGFYCDGKKPTIFSMLSKAFDFLRDVQNQ